MPLNKAGCEWIKREIGFSLGFVGLTVIFTQTFVIRWAVKTLGETNSAYIGLLVSAVGFCMLGLATTSWMAYVAFVPLAFMGLAMPSIRSLMAARVPDNAQGELQRSISSLTGLTLVGMPILMTQLFRTFSAPGATIYLPGAPYFLAAALMFLSAHFLTKFAKQATR